MKTDHDKIAEKAYLKYIQRGCMDGFDQQDWLEAEQEVKSSKKKTIAKTAVRKTGKVKK
jgi:hypothetical protein